MVALIAVAAMAGASDWLSCEWHGAREAGQLGKLAALSAVIECLNWIPLWLALTWRDPTLVVAAVVGSVIGTTWGGARYRRQRRESNANRHNDKN